jgi:hypothetical protein
MAKRVQFEFDEQSKVDILPRGKADEMRQSIASLTAELAVVQAECKRLRGDGQFVVHTGDDFEYYNTEQEAIDAAQRAVQDWRDIADPDWPSEVENVWIARVVHDVTQREYFDNDGKQFYDYQIAAEAGGDREDD